MSWPHRTAPRRAAPRAEDDWLSLAPRRLALHVVVLANLALAQPLLDVLRKNAEFFVAHRAGPADLILLVALLCVGIPGALAALVLVALRLRAEIGWATWAVQAVILVAIMLAPPVKEALSGHSGWLVVALCVSLGVVAVGIYRRFEPARALLSYVAIGLPLIPVLFFGTSNVSSLFRDASPDSAHAALPDLRNTPDIVLLVLDELPLSSLLDEDLEIDEARYPNFGRVARFSTWYPEAGGVSQATFYAVPAILAGRSPTGKILPIASSYPDTLFTLLGKRYEIVAHESGTDLCPAELCAATVEQPSTGARLASLLRDVAVVFGHVVAPADLADGLPPISAGWNDFAASAEPSIAVTSATATSPKEIFDEFGRQMASDRVALFRSYLQRIRPRPRPTLYYLHTLLPHVPWEYLPSGKRYGVRPRVAGLIDKAWSTDRWAADLGLQRHLSQVGLADRLLGELLDRLEETGILDRSLLIVVADHGVSFLPGLPRRHLSPANVGDLMSVPLFLKSPGQTRAAVSQRRAQTIDLLPTIAAHLGTELPAPADGVSLLADSFPQRARRTAFADEFEEFHYGSLRPSFAREVRRRIELFGATGVPTLTGGLAGPGTLIGRSAADFEVVDAPDIRAEIDNLSLFLNVDLESDFVPAYVTGTLRVPAGSAAGRQLALALNGRVATAVRTHDDGGQESFAALLPEEAFHDGRNDLELYEAASSAGRVSLRRVSTGFDELRYVLQRSRGGWQIAAGGKGPSFRVADDAVAGWVDNWDRRSEEVYLVEGWAADLAAGEPADTVLVFSGGAAIAAGRPSNDRPDVVDHFDEPGIARCGFSIAVPAVALPRGPADVRVFATSARGRAAELRQQGRGRPRAPSAGEGQEASRRRGGKARAKSARTGSRLGL